MTHYYSFTLKSGNRKTGPIPTTMTSSDSCPDTCSLKDKGCYAKYGVTGIWWRKLDKGERGLSLDELCAKIKALPDGTLWRHNVAGDLPKLKSKYKEQIIDIAKLKKLIRANKGKRGFTYTHYRYPNLAYIQYANNKGFIINISTDNVDEADMTFPRLPTVTLVPDHTVTKTPNGHKIVVCPAQYNPGSKDVTCATCKLCAIPDRDFIIGFIPHGAAKKSIQTKLKEGTKQ